MDGPVLLVGRGGRRIRGTPRDTGAASDAFRRVGDRVARAARSRFGAPGRLPNCSTDWRSCSWSTANKDRRVAIAMEHALQAILDSLPPRRRRSKLEPYAALIRALRGRGRSYREIVTILRERCGLRVAVHTVYHFVRARAQKHAAPRPPRRRRPGLCDVRQRRRRRPHRSHPAGPRRCGHASRPSSGARRRRPRSRKRSSTTSTSPCS